MDVFRVDSTSPYEPHRETGPSGSMNRKKAKRPKGQTSEQDDVVVLSEQTEGGSEPIEDYYAPSERSDEPESPAKG